MKSQTDGTSICDFLYLLSQNLESEYCETSARGRNSEYLTGYSPNRLWKWSNLQFTGPRKAETWSNDLITRPIKKRSTRYGCSFDYDGRDCKFLQLALRWYQRSLNLGRIILAKETEREAANRRALPLRPSSPGRQ